MQVGVLITEGGPHPPEKWADVTAGQIIDISAQAQGPMLAEANEFRAKLVQLLTGHHDLVQQHERDRLEQHHDYMMAPLDPTQHLDDPVEEIVRLSRGTSFQGHFAKPETQRYLRECLAHNFASAMHVERLWHCDQNTEHPHRVAYKAAFGLKVPEDEEGSNENQG
jgi:hypothetical protein